LKNMYQELFLPYDQSWELKQLDFNEPCFAQTNDYKRLVPLPFDKPVTNRTLSKVMGYRVEEYQICTFPTWEQTFMWFIKNHNLNYFVFKRKDGKWSFSNGDISINDQRLFDTYEGARLSCVKHMIKEITK